jgi:undecaprenyl-diphosphatase
MREPPNLNSVSLGNGVSTQIFHAGAPTHLADRPDPRAAFFPASIALDRFLTFGIRMLTHLNDSLFLLLNASGHPDFAVVALAEVAAEWVIYATMMLVAALWIWGQPRRRGQLLATVVGVSAAIGINQLLGMLWYEPRPFIAGLGRTLIEHAPDNSFPSDHATFMCSLGFSLIITAAARRWGILVGFGGLLVAWARVYVGVHYPIDMVASFFVALVGAGISLSLVTLMGTWPRSIAERVYFGCLRMLHLPPRLFPRQSLAVTSAEYGNQR